MRVAAALYVVLRLTDGFVVPGPSFQRTTNVKSVLDPVKAPLESYASFWIPAFDEMTKAGVPDWLLHWGHPAAMASVFLSMGLYGSFLGFQVRQGNGSGVLPLSLGETSRELHPKVMAGAFFFFALGGQGGLVLNKYFGNDVLASNHALTAFLCLGLLGIRTVLPAFFDKAASLRTVHTVLGSLTMATLVVHAVLGLQLGISF